MSRRRQKCHPEEAHAFGEQFLIPDNRQTQRSVEYFAGFCASLWRASQSIAPRQVQALLSFVRSTKSNLPEAVAVLSSVPR